jgi:SAM-dependent methyltransferase
VRRNGHGAGGAFVYDDAVLREIGHFLWNAPGVLRLKGRLSQVELYQELMRRADAAGLDARRAALVGDLRGEIVEIGCGTGMMFGHYRADARVSAVEPDEAFAALGREAAIGKPVEVVSGRGEALPFESGRFDAAVSSLVLCSVDDPRRVLDEVRRVLRPGGELRLIEHVRSEARVAGWMMDRLDGAWLKLNAQGCHLNRDPLPAIAAAGFQVRAVEPFQVWSKGLPAFPMRLIRATSTAAGSRG